MLAASDARDALLLDLYACPADPARWTGVLDRLCRETGARSAVIQAFRMEHARLRVERVEQDSYSRDMHGRLPPEVSEEANPRLDVRRLPRGLNRMVGDDALFDPREPDWRRLQERLAQSGLGRFVGCLHQVGEDAYLALALHRAADDRRTFSRSQVAWLSALAPHLVQAFGLGARLRAGAEAHAALSRMFDRFRCGILVCRGDGRVLWTNRGAESLLGSRDGLRLRAGGLQADAGEASRRLLDAIGETARAGEGGGDRYLRLGEGAHALHVVMQPFQMPEPAGFGQSDAVLLAVTAADGRSAIPPEAIVRLFGVTPAEARLAAALVAGRSLEQYAAERGVSIGTVRGQMKQVLAKTGAARQSELVRLVLSSAAARVARGAGAA